MRDAAIAALISMALTGMAEAQTPRPAPAAPPAAAPAAPPPTTRAQVSVQPAQPEQRPPQLTKTETAYFDNWQTTCQEFVNPARRQCSGLLQLVQSNPQTNSASVLISWVLTQAEQQLTATLQTPTGVSIAPGIDLKVGRTVKKVPFARCDAQRCEGTFAIDEALGRELTAAESVEVVITALQGNAVTFSIPIKGYDKAAQALRR